MDEVGGGVLLAREGLLEGGDGGKY
jgi:hypothetical protein